MALNLRLKDLGGPMLRNHLQIVEDPPEPGDACHGCATLASMPTKRKVVLWLWRQAKRRYPNLTFAQFKSRLIQWLNNHPNVRDALPDGEGW